MLIRTVKLERDSEGNLFEVWKQIDSSHPSYEEWVNDTDVVEVEIEKVSPGIQLKKAV